MTIKIRMAALLICCLIAVPRAAFSQSKNNFKLGKITSADFKVSSPAIDSASNAVILTDIGSSTLDGNTDGFFSLKYTQSRRIKILSKKGMEAADVVIVLHASGSTEEKLEECKAVTYNLENGEVKQTKLESSNIFKEKPSIYASLRKFTFPNVKEGSIIEYTYTITSPFLGHLRPWEFQGTSMPRLYTEYTVKIPEFFSYVFLAQGYIKLKNEAQSKIQSYSIIESNGTEATRGVTLTGYENTNKWTATDVPALREEAYTSTIDNHLTKIDFQLKQMKFPEQPTQDYIGSWAQAAEKLLKREDFGYEITRPNNWLSDDVKQVVAGAATDDEKKAKIYAFVRDNFTATQNSGMYMNDHTTLKDIFRKKSGNVAEINMLLIAMLRQADLSADPVLISTRSNGWAHAFYPLMSKYNYLICETVIGGKTVYLDASQPKMGLGRLSPFCYNGAGFVVKTRPSNAVLSADSITEKKVTTLFLTQDESKGLKGTYKSTPGYYESTELRKKLAKESLDDLVKEASKRYSFPLEIKNQFVDSLSRLETPLTVGYDVAFDFDNQDIVYINPMFSEATAKNPFSAADRQYPVEMPFKLEEVFVLSMAIPKGYKLEEIPKSAKVRLNEDDGLFEYLISSDGKKVMLTSKVTLKKSTFPPEDYQALRDFFGYVTKKQGEHIVLKKAP